MGSSVLTGLDIPIVAAPMAGGPSTPQLAGAVSAAGGLGFLAGGYRDAAQVGDQIRAVRTVTDRAFGLNLFVSSSAPVDLAAVDAYAERLRPMAQAAGAQLGAATADDDGLADKIDLAIAERVPVVSFTFGLPDLEQVDALRAAGCEVWMTVTGPDEASLAVDAGADVLVVQGVEAGGHRGVFVDDAHQSTLPLLTALQLIAAQTDVPLVGAGAIMTGPTLAAVVVAGARAGQLGTAYLRSAEAGTSPVHRAAIGSAAPTVLTRAYSGRLARGIVNRWHEQHGEFAPAAYPHVNAITSSLRARGRDLGDPDLVNLWAGQGHALVRDGSAADITGRIVHEARAALSAAR